jgi:CAAX prenyl protease-like protein
MSKGSFFSGFNQPALIRILPFALFMAFVVASSLLPAPVAGSSAWDTRLVYVLRTFAVAALLLFFWRHYSELDWDELRRCEWVRALLAGGFVFVFWIALDQPWATVGGGAGFDPRDAAGGLDWFLIVPRLLGLAIIVPLMEELFWRSFIQRWIHHPQFLTVKPAACSLRALIVASILFALEHSMVLAGLLAGLVYGWVYMRSGNLWSAVIAHGATNGLLGVWILVTGEWHLW